MAKKKTEILNKNYLSPSNSKEDAKLEKDNLINLIDEIMVKAKKAKELIGGNADD